MLLTIVTFIIILGLLIFIHEFGHFAIAKKMGVKVDEFGFGFPPRIFGWKKVNGKRKFFIGRGEVESEDTIYSLNWIPIGGFVKIKGEQGEGKQEKDSFANKKIWKRTLILSGGVIMNFVLCAVLLSVGFSIGLPRVLDGEVSRFKIRDKKIQIVSVLKDSPAYEAGLKVGDTIVTVDDKKINEVEGFQKHINENLGKPVKVGIKEDNKVIKKEVIPKAIGEFKNLSDEEKSLQENKTLIGIGLVKTGIVFYPWYLAIWEGLKATVLLTWQIIVVLFLLIKNLILKQVLVAEMTGPIGIAVLTGQVVRLGFIYVLQFTAILSLNLAIINFLPIPALDGGRILFLAIEKIRGKAIKQKIENFAHNMGFILLMILVLIITYRDIVKFGGSFLKKIKDIFI